jgi:predicted transposase YdaD
MGKQSNQYDKIFRENIEAVIPGLIQNLLGITVISSEELPDDIQHTKERKPDVLKKVTDTHGNTFVLHLEFQLVDEPEMVYRMADYYIMLARKYKLLIRQYVLFLGSVIPKMATRYESELIRYEFTLIAFTDLDYHTFLKSGNPEEIILGVLADFMGESPENVLYQIIRRVEETTVGDLALKRYFSQLRVLAQLRNLGQILRDLAMDSIAKFVSIEKDAAYLVGFDKGEEKVVASLLKKLNYSLEQIADIAGVPVEFVKGVQQKLSADK